MEACSKMGNKMKTKHSETSPGPYTILPRIESGINIMTSLKREGKWKEDKEREDLCTQQKHYVKIQSQAIYLSTLR